MLYTTSDAYGFKSISIQSPGEMPAAGGNFLVSRHQLLSEMMILSGKGHIPEHLLDRAKTLRNPQNVPLAAGFYKGKPYSR